MAPQAKVGCSNPSHNRPKSSKQPTKKNLPKKTPNRVKQMFKLNKRPTGLNGHLSIRDFTLTSCQKGSYLYINNPIIE